MLEKLDDVHDDLVNRLIRAARDRKSLMHTPAVITSDIDARTMVLREFDKTAWTLRFHTDTRAPKVAAIEADPRVAVLFYDKGAKIQIRVRGITEREDGPLADAYYDSRSLKSRLGAWASKQSRPLASRTALMAEVARVTGSHGPVPKRPPHWGGIRILPLEIEFWADGAFRLHDRFRWTRTASDSSTWKIMRLNP